MNEDLIQFLKEIEDFNLKYYEKVKNHKIDILKCKQNWGKM